jgi:phage baseplate assembly protein W
MKTIAVSNGDIQLNSGKIQFVTGSNKLFQDLARWLQEPLGTGFTSPGFGSLLTSMVGGTQNSGTVTTITNEITRIIQLYQGQQTIELQQAQNVAQLSNWNKSEIIQNIVSVDVTIQNSSIIAAVTINTLSGNVINLNLAINNNGVNVYNG